MRKLVQRGIWAAAFILAATVGVNALMTAAHFGAPPLHITCPRGGTAVYHWEKGTHAAGPGEIEYRGWTEWASCSASLTVSGG